MYSTTAAALAVAAVALFATQISFFTELSLFIGNPLQTLGDRVNQQTSDYYVGYRGPDFDKPWAKYFNDAVAPLSELNQDFLNGLEQSPVPAEQGISIQDAGKALNKPGYLPLENGYTTLDDGTMMLAIRADMPPNFSGEMYDWWFSWHINDTTKYKLWHPKQHQYAAVTDEVIKRQQTKTSYREKYWNTTSFVDEYIGSSSDKLSISFIDPRLLGFTTNNPATNVETVVVGFVKTFRYTKVDVHAMALRGFKPWDTVLAHQVRQKPDGSGWEIRSRFWFGSLLVRGMKVMRDPYELAHDLCVHCATEMTHLGTFLPALFDEFKDDFAT